MGLGEKRCGPVAERTAPENSSGTGVLGQALLSGDLGIPFPASSLGEEVTMVTSKSSRALILFQALAKGPLLHPNSPTTPGWGKQKPEEEPGVCGGRGEV